MGASRQQVTFDDVTEIDLDGHVDGKGVRYIGKANRHPDGTWRCLADVGGALCLVEVRIRPEADPDAETLYGVEMPGCLARRRRDSRAKAPRPDKPLVMYFTRAQLTALRANVAQAILRSQ